MTRHFLSGAALMLLPLGAAQAGGVDPVDPVAYSTMMHGNYAAAEQRLMARVERGSTEPDVLLNLAHVYARSSRTANAAATYRQVLAQPNVQMELGDGSAGWSHDLAQRGLRRLTAMASR